MADLITTSDISPNAGILGTQIADKTLQLRNLSDDVFGIVNSDSSGLANTIVSSAQSISDPGAGTWGTATTAVTTLAHNLGYVPAIIAYIAQPGQPYVLLPYTNSTFSASAGRIWTLSVQVDSTNVYFISEVAVLHQSFSIASGDYTAKFYLLKESAAP